jgi:hypothetical protein
LVSLGLSVDINERRLALTRANEHGLNVERVAIVTAERTIEKVFSVSKSQSIYLYISFPDPCLTNTLLCSHFHPYPTHYLRSSTSNLPQTNQKLFYSAPSSGQRSWRLHTISH